MFKPQKPTNSNQPNRQRLPLVERQPKQEDIATLFTSALRIKGTLFELPIKPPFSQTYLLTCEYDNTSNAALWAMYSGEEGSISLWNGPQTDLDLVFDMVYMACQAKGTPQTQLPPELGYASDTSSQTQNSAPAQNNNFANQDFSNPSADFSQPTSVPEITNFIDLINKGQPNLLLGHLFVEAGMVPERCLDSALKLQEMVRKGKLTNEQAILALKRAAQYGGNLDNEIIEWAMNPNATLSDNNAALNPKAPQIKPNPSVSASGNDTNSTAKVMELLTQAGLISEADIEAAQKVKNKHGGDLGQILVSAGKISGKTLEAAAQCHEYIKHQCLRIDRAITALHYCERMRVTLKEALAELNIEIQA